MAICSDRRLNDMSVCIHPLPPELFEPIISHLASDKASLKACSLVAHSFLYPSQRYLFRQLFIYLHGHPSQAPRVDKFLSRLCARPPHHKAHVESLGIEAVNSTCPFNRKLLLDVVRSLGNLKRLDLRCRWERNFDATDNASGVSTHDILRECFRPSITHLSLYGSTHFPLEGLSSCTGLTHLSLTTIAILSTPMYSPPSPRIFLKFLFLGPYLPPLERVNSIVAVRFFMHPLCPWDLNQLETFGFRARSYREYKDVQRLMQSFSLDHITTFAIEAPEDMIECPTEHVDQSIDLSTMPNLTCLTFSIEEHAPSDTSYIPWMVAELETIPENNQLRELHLRVNLDDIKTMTTVHEQAWGLLDNRLAEAKFNELELVHFRVYLRFHASKHKVANGEVVMAFQNALPKTLEKKTLRLDISDKEWYFLSAEYPSLHF